MRDKDDLDLLLDSALSTYADPGPDSSFEQRILARIDEERFDNTGRPAPRSSNHFFALPHRRWIPWFIALPLAAGVLFFSLPKAKVKPSPATAMQQAHQLNPSPGTPLAMPQHLTETSRAAARRPLHTRPQSVPLVAQAAPLPKLDVFPTPQPATPEEKALSAIAIRTASPELQALAKAQTQDAVLPLPVASIHIPPLEPPTPGANNR